MLALTTTNQAPPSRSKRQGRKPRASKAPQQQQLALVPVVNKPVQKQEKSSKRRNKQPKVTISYERPPISKQMYKSINTRGRRTADLSLYKHVKTIHDAFLMAYLHHLMVPEAEYPLPAIEFVGTVGVPDINSPILGDGGYGTTSMLASIAASYVNPQDAANASDERAFHAVQGSNVAIGRYETFAGVRTYTINTQTLSTGQLELVVFYDPFDLLYPIKVISPPVNPTLTSTYNDITLYSTMPAAGPFVSDWNNDPFLFAKVMAGPSDPLLISPDTANLYFIGGASLSVDVLNRNLYTNCAFQSRTSSNTIHSFSDNLQNLWRTDLGTALGFTDTPVESMGCTSVYSGEKWTQCHIPAPTLTGAPLKLYHSHALRRAWCVGAPVIRILIRTQTTNSGTPGPVSFNVRLNNWVGISPVDYKVAGACTEETVPFALPSWARIARTFSVLHSPDYSVASAYTSAATQVVSTIASSVPADSEFTRKLQSNPKAAPKQLSFTDKASSWMKTAADWGGKLVALESIVSKIIAAAFAA